MMSTSDGSLEDIIGYTIQLSIVNGKKENINFSHLTQSMNDCWQAFLESPMKLHPKE